MTLRFTLIITAFCCLLPAPARAQQDIFPFVGKITGADVNVRAGQSENFERLCQLDRGDEVLVVGQAYNWYKIKLPKIAKLYISAEYIYLLNDRVGGVIGDRVNVRAGADPKHSVVGQVLAGEEVQILEKGEKWHQIAPLDKTYGWVHEDFVTFKSKDISQFKDKSPEPVKENPVIEAHKTMNETAEKNELDERIQVQKSMSVSGYLKSVETIEGIHYRLDVNGETLYFLSGINNMLEDFVHYKVDVDGIVDTERSDQYEYPVLNVKRIQLIL